MVVAGTPDILVEQAGRIVLSWLRLLPVLQDGGHGAVGAGTERQRSRAGGVQPLGAVALLQTEDADAGAESLLRMRAGAQDELDQGGASPIAAASRWIRSCVQSR
jgi:hypothetical protein